VEEVTEGEEDFTAAVAEDFTVAADFTEVAGERFAGAEASLGEAALGSAADAPTAYIVEAATLEDEAITEVAAVTAGAAGVTVGAVGEEGIGAEDMVTDGAGDLALGGRIGVGDGGDIRMAATTAPGITGLTPIILTRTTDLRTIPRAIRILTGTTILHRRIPTHGPCPTRTDLQDPGGHQYREAERIQTTQTMAPRPLRRVGRLSPLTG
jgi:hypothetical protein